MPLTITPHSAARCFEGVAYGCDGHDGQSAAGAAVCSYRRVGDVLVLHHTEVPPALQGQGLAGELVQAVLDWARAQGLHVRPTCSYVAAYMRRHPETQDLLDRPGDTQ